MGMLQKQDRQCFYTKKVMVLCVFLLFGFGSQADGQGIAGNGNQIVEQTRREEINDLEEDQELNERRLVTPQTLLILTQNGLKEATNKKINQLFRGCCCNHEQQTFWINENGTAEITSPLLQQSWVVEEDNGKETNKIENTLQSNENCAICTMPFKAMKKKKIFVYNCDQRDMPHMLCYECYMPQYQTNNENDRIETCPICRSRVVPIIPEDISKEDKIRLLKNTRNINYVERNQQKPSHWKLYLRNKDYGRKIWYKTRINPDNWFIINDSFFDMEVLELNLNDPKDLRESHIKLIKGLKFHKVKFNNDQEPREIYLVVKHKDRLQILHNGSAVFNERKNCGVDHQRRVMIKNRDVKRETLDRVICRYIYTGETGDYNNIFVFNKNNIEYLKETKGLVIFCGNIENISIGLEGEELIFNKDIADLFIGQNKVGLACDNVRNFQDKKATKYFLLSPVDLPKINQIKNIMKDGHKIPIPNNSLELIDDNCFLLTLFKLINKKKSTISLTINPEMVEREIAPSKKFLDVLKEMFAVVKIEGEKIHFKLKDYAIIVLLYFGENALNVFEITLLITIKKQNDIWDEFIREGGPVLTNPILKNQNAKNFILIDESRDFAVNVKIMENIEFQNLTMNPETKYINDSFVYNNKHDQPIMENELVNLILYPSGAISLSYDKDINKINKLGVFTSGVTIEGVLWMSEVLEIVRTKNIKFPLSNENYLVLVGF